MTRNTTSTLFYAVCILSIAATEGRGATATDYPSLQQAIDENPGGAVSLNDKRYQIDAPLVIKTADTKLLGPGVVVQTNPHAAIVEMDGAPNVLLRDITFTRAADAQETDQPGIYATGCANMHIDNVRVLENHGGRASIYIERGQRIRIERCEIVNYKYIGVQDRTDNPRYAIAFRCIDGAGISLSGCHVAQVLNNRILENRILPTRETVEKYHLGEVLSTGDPSQRIQATSPAYPGWHQGSAVEVHGPLDSSHALLQGNYVENAAQGFDIHADMIILAQNHINTCHTGIKTMHGARHVMILGNIIERADDEGIYLGSNDAFRAQPAQGDQPPRPANTNNGCIVANNIITEMGYGTEAWALWQPKVETETPLAIKIKGIGYDGQMTRDDLVIIGNIVYHHGPDGMIEGGRVVFDNPPHYKYALWIEPAALRQMKNLKITGNVFHPGEFGVSNLEEKGEKSN